MQQINSAAALVAAQAKLARPISSDRRPNSSLSSKAAPLVVLLFTRLADLFGHKATSRGLVIYADSEKKIFSEAFKLWCRKLEDLNESHFKTGMSGIEKKAEEAYRAGDELWPPSYAEFRALAIPKAGNDIQAHKYFPPLLALEDQSAREARYERGMEETGKLLAMFGEETPKPQCDNSKALAALEIAKEKLKHAK